jgi:ABC-type polysaccharide/polyol phosphate export permease
MATLDRPMAATTPAVTAAPEAPPLTVHSPTAKRVRPSDVWATRRVAKIIGQRDIKAKYKQSALGPLWLLIAPMGMLFAITIAFSGVTDVNTGDVPYVLFALVGLVVWTYVQLSVTVGAQAIVGNYSLVRRSATPRIAMITGTLIGNLPPLGVLLAAAFVLGFILEGLPPQVVLVPLLLVWLIFFVGVLTLLIASITVRFRDVIALLPLLIQAGLFVTPVGYDIDGAPQNIQTLLSLNPASGLIEAWRWAMLDMAPDMTIIAISGVWTVVLAFVGWRVFAKLEVFFADVI